MVHGRSHRIKKQHLLPYPHRHRKNTSSHHPKTLSCPTAYFQDYVHDLDHNRCAYAVHWANVYRKDTFLALSDYEISAGTFGESNLSKTRYLPILIIQKSEPSTQFHKGMQHDLLPSHNSLDPRVAGLTPGIPFRASDAQLTDPILA